MTINLQQNLSKGYMPGNIQWQAKAKVVERFKIPFEKIINSCHFRKMLF
ncbi:TPA: hypothetical protein OO122_002909 [Legionella pneumophila]|nr:hypothetical protein [Legionella pneumophila]HAT2067686.1 hypothetical protein [Legionella pneumophila]HCR5123636.1 hypothetical protein [Legionella pneumophila]HCR5126676.1 hypothetical protein [Legionella pneumophila]HCR5129684.1 hypothetical protein [Legionella pneumophila]HCR5132729.1 hypothetical protein [Legionella pneumophila]